MKLFFIKAIHHRHPSHCSWRAEYVIMAEDEKVAISVTEIELSIPHREPSKDVYNSDYFEIKEIQNPIKPYLTREDSDY